MNRYLFLDMDGVLNSHDYFFGPNASVREEPRQTAEWLSQQIDPAAVVHLNAIILATNAQVVISSSWRLAHKLGIIARALQHRGFVGRVIGKTGYSAVGDSTNRRGLEIQAWLDGQPNEPRRLVILDDSADFGHLLDFHVRTTWERGLLEEHVVPAIKMLLHGPGPYVPGHELSEDA